MKQKIYLTLLVMSVAAMSACTTNIYPEEPVRYDGELIKVQVDRIKVKSSYYQVQSRVQNKSEKNLLIMFNSIECYCDGQAGRPQYVLGIGERDFDLPPLVSKNLQFMCRFARSVECGEMKIKINSIFANPNGDGKTRGEILARDLTFRIN